MLCDKLNVIARSNEFTTLLFPRLLLQKLWESKLKWDDEVCNEIKQKFIEWLEKF